MTEEVSIGEGIGEVLSQEEGIRRLKEYADWCQTEEGQRHLSNTKIYEGPDDEVYMDSLISLIEKTGWTELHDLVWNWNAKTNEVSIIKRVSDD